MEEAKEKRLDHKLPPANRNAKKKRSFLQLARAKPESKGKRLVHKLSQAKRGANQKRPVNQLRRANRDA